jgi:hypothetical protein
LVPPPHACSTTTLPSWSPCLESRPQNSCSLKAWVPLHLQQLLWLRVAQHQPASLRAHAVCKLGYPTSAAPAVALEAHIPMQVDPRASTALWAPDNSSLPVLLPLRYPQLATQCQGDCHHTPKWTPDSRLCGARRLTSPQSMEAQLTRQRVKMPDSPLREGKL